MPCCSPSHQLNFPIPIKPRGFTPRCLCMCLSLGLDFPPLLSVAAQKIAKLQVSGPWPLLQEAISADPSPMLSKRGIYHSAVITQLCAWIPPKMRACQRQRASFAPIHAWCSHNARHREVLKKYLLKCTLHLCGSGKNHSFKIEKTSF